MAELRAVFKLTGLLGLLLLGVGLSVPLRLGLWLAPRRATPWRDRIAQRWFHWVNRTLGVRLRVIGEPAPHVPLLLVANHISWLDICMLGEAVPCSFISKAEVKSWPVIGFLCNTVQTVFVQRGDAASAAAVIARLEAMLARGRNVVFFPEGKSSRGEHVQPFRRRLFRAARTQNVPIQTVALVYPHAGGIHPAVPYADTISFSESLWAVLRQRQIEAVLRFGGVIAADAADNEAGLARLAWEQVRQSHAGLLRGESG